MPLRRGSLGRRGAARSGDPLASLVGDARDGGGSVWEGSDVPSEGSYVPPTVVVVPQGCRIWGEEVFGPVTAVRSYTDERGVVEEVSGWPYGLEGYVCSHDLGHAAGLASQVAIGIVGVNNGAPNTPEVPFGGFKQSGTGREGGIQGLEEFVEWQTISLASTKGGRQP